MSDKRRQTRSASVALWLSYGIQGVWLAACLYGPEFEHGTVSRYLVWISYKYLKWKRWWKVKSL